MTTDPNPAPDSGYYPLGEIQLGIVCPMANEESTAEQFIASVLDHCHGFQSVQLFVVVDNASTDNTRKLLERLQQQHHELRVIWAPENRTVVDAYLRGYREALNAACDWILEIDAGFSHQPGDIPQFFSKMLEGYDCVFGSRFCSGGRISNASAFRYIVSSGGTLLANLVLGTTLRDMTSGFELFRRDALTSALRQEIRSQGHFFQTEIKFHCRHLKVAEVPIHYTSPSPRLNFRLIVDAFKNLTRLAFSR